MLGDNIKELMKIKKISSKKLAEIVEVSPTHISYVINNKRYPSIELLNKIADALGVIVDDFFKGNDENKDSNQNKEQTIEKDLPIVPEEFTDPKEARAYVDKHQIFGSSGFDADNLSDEEILEFANELLRQMEIISYMYKK